MSVAFLLTTPIVVSRPRVLTWIGRAFAAAFVALGARLALPDR